MAEFPGIEEMAKKIAETALDNFEYQGKTIGEWVKIIVEQQPCDDTVSRQVALSSLEELDWDTAYERSQVEEMLKSLPPVTPIRPKGKWETGYTYPDGEYWKCSVCKELIKVRIPMHFCPNCSADMRGGKE